MEIKEEREFEKEISESFVLVDFYATWCGPCKMLSPIIEEISEEIKEIKVLKVDVDKNENIARQFGIMSIPTLMIFKEGAYVDKKVGYMSKEEIIEWINNI